VKLDFDLTIVDVLCRRLGVGGLIERGWTGPVIDALVLDRQVDPYRPGRRTLVDLCRVYGVTIGQAHSAECDAEAAAAVLLAMADRYGDLAAASAHELHAAQAQFHRDWVAANDEWRQSRGLEAMDPSESVWPIAPVPDTEAGAA
jgi:DNA polymerase-3 subunit epsilon